MTMLCGASCSLSSRVTTVLASSFSSSFSCAGFRCTRSEARCTVAGFEMMPAACLHGNSNGRRGMVTRDDEEADPSSTTYP
ncbi:hypothetical protein BJV78DRAFT_1256521, partial [Lactifluus subvellereus]